MNVQFIVDDYGETHTSVEMENILDRFTMMEEMIQIGSTIQRMYWRSKIDPNHIEYIEPKIHDAFTFCIDFVGGNRFYIEMILRWFKHKNLQPLENAYNKLTEQDIKDYATAMINSL